MFYLITFLYLIHYMTSKRNQYTREFKLEAISLVVDQKRKIPDVADSLRIGKFTFQKWLI